MSKRIRPWILAGFALIFIASGLAADKPLASAKLAQALEEEVSGEIAYRYTNLISGYDRVQASEGWRAAAEMIRQELLRLGYDDAVIEGWPSDGTRRYYNYRSVIGWRAAKGELWMLSPSRARLCSYEEIPLTLVKHSGPGNVETELVDVGTGLGETAYRGKDVKGKIVLATGPTSAVMREAVFDRGAVGVLTYFAPDTRPGYPNMIRYTALWPTWEEKDKLGFAFNISKNQGATLKRLLEEGKKVVLRAEVEAEFYPTEIETLTASFPGAVEPDKEILLIAHLCHPMPSANDNASGSGGILEMARALRRMVDSRVIEPPRRTIRFLWVPEFNGLVPYIQSHLQRTRNTLAAINCDMIGEDLHKTGGTLNIFRTPDSMPTFLNDVVADFAALAESLGLTSLNGSRHPFIWKELPYSGGSDHVVFNDGALRVPSIMLNRGDIFHHTSLDTMDKVDPTELRRASFLALGSAYYLASAGDKEALGMARLIIGKGYGRFTADLFKGFNALYAAGALDELHAAYKQALNIIAHSGRRERASVLSTLAFVGDKAVEREIAGLNSPLDSAMLSFPKEAAAIYRSLCAKLGGAPKPLALTEAERPLTRLVPVRSEDFVAPFQTDYLVEKLGPPVRDELRLRGNAAYEVLNFVDGKRTMHDIFLAVSAQFGPIDPAHLEAFFKVLERAGLVRLRKV